MDTLNGINGTAERFTVNQAGAIITNFNAGEDRIVIDLESASTSETLTYLDLVSPLAAQLNAATAITGQGSRYASPMSVNAAGTGVDILIPDFDGTGTTRLITVSSTTLTPTQLLTRLATNPGDFEIRSKGNTVVDWNDITFDALKLAGFAPAASVRVFSLVHTAINDAVQGVLDIGGRQTYLESIGVNLPAPAAGASADVAAAAAASRVLNTIFSDPFTFSNNGGTVNPNFTPLNNQPVQNVTAYYSNIFSTAVDAAATQSGASQASINAAIAYGNAVADQLLGFRATDGFLRNEDGSQVRPSDFIAEYANGIESEENLLGKDGTVGRLSDGTSLIGTGPQNIAITAAGTPLIFGVGNSTPGAWRRAEDTLGLGPNGGFAGLASPEVANTNQTWLVPGTSFFSDQLNPPPLLDTIRHNANVAEVAVEGSLLDIPLAPGTQVLVNNRTVTVNGVTTVIPGLSSLGTVVNDTSTSETGYAGVVGDDARPSIAGASNGVDGIGTTSAERTVIAHVWANAEGGVGPNYAYQKVAQQLAINNGTTLADTALIFATLDQAFADAFQNLWQEKWDVDYFWRPVSAVRNGEELAGTASIDNNSYTPKENTPQHPCHPSGTSVSAALAATILGRFYGENQTFTVSADVNPVSARLANALAPAGGNVDGVPLEEVSRTYTSFNQVLDETRLSRIYAGAHFRFATERGVQLGELTGEFFLDNSSFVAPSALAAVGSSGNDDLIGGVGALNGTNNIVFTGSGNDSIDLVPLATSITAGGNRISAGTGNDSIFVNRNDRVFGDAGDDTFEAADSRGGNRMSGNAGNDTFFLGRDDRALGGDGNDRFFVGCCGGNTLVGGLGNDQFWIVNGEVASDFNTVSDFQIGVDVIGISGAASLGITSANLLLSQVGANTQISFNGDVLAVLSGIQSSALSTSNSGQFVFA